jgi:ABC-type sugar transport system ATPase subunit
MIRLEDLHVRAGRFVLAIDSLEVQPGEYVVVLGPTASGKTVLLETIAGLRALERGKIWFGDHDLSRRPPEHRGVGLVYQDYALFSHLSVSDNIGFGLRARKHAEARELVRSVAAKLGIEGLLERWPQGLSGGEQQRVALARALAVQPRVLLLDEPLSALDGPTRTELRDELSRLHQELGTTIVHVTHDLDEAMILGDRLAVLIDGDLHQVGTPEQVTRTPRNGAVARLVGLANLLPVKGSEIVAGRRKLLLEGGLQIVAQTGGSESAGSGLAAIPAEEIEVWPLHREPARTGENLYVGTIKMTRIQRVHASLDLDVIPEAPGTQPLLLVAHVLRPQLRRDGLLPGVGVGIHVPPEAVHVCSDLAPAGAGELDS